MSGKVFLAVIFLLVVLGTGCSEPMANFSAGFATGAITKINQANDAMAQINSNITALNEKSQEIQVLIKKDPAALAGTIDPNLGNALDYFTANLRTLEANAQQFKNDKGKIDWERMIYAAIIGVFGGGTGVNLIKNRKP